MNLKYLYDKWIKWEISTLNLITHLNLYANRSFNDIRTLFKLSIYLKVPLYVFIRNELGLTDDELIKVINIPADDTRIKVVLYLEDNDAVELKKKLIASISKLEKDDLQVIEKILPAFEKMR